MRCVHVKSVIHGVFGVCGVCVVRDVCGEFYGCYVCGVVWCVVRDLVCGVACGVMCIVMCAVV